MVKRFARGGVHPPENKFSKDIPISNFPYPLKVTIPITQHLGQPSELIVKKNDKVKTGQLISKISGFLSANVHSSVTGTISNVQEEMDTSGYKKMAVTITADQGEEQWEQEVDTTTDLIKDFIESDAEKIIQKIQERGIVGLGGATFPSHVKLLVPKGKKAKLLIVNGVECEPFLTSDHRLMLEKSEEIIIGTKILMKALKVYKAIIGIEENKPDAILKLSELTKDIEEISVESLKVQYPQGGEKQLISALTKKEVPSGGLPIDIGMVVHNVGTVFAVYEAIQKNKPLIERVVTVTGINLRKRANYLVRIGTLVSDLLESVGGWPKDAIKLISGGPMMGKALTSLDVPVVKGTSGIIVVPANYENAAYKKEGNCIRCARCVFNCPIGLEPYLLKSLSEKSFWDLLKDEHVMDCIECGCCSYGCPANLSLLDYIRVGKSKVAQIIRQLKK